MTPQEYQEMIAQQRAQANAGMAPQGGVLQQQGPASPPPQAPPGPQQMGPPQAPPGGPPGGPGIMGAPQPGAVAPPTPPAPPSKWQQFKSQMKEMGMGKGAGMDGGLLANPMFQLGMGILSENTKPFGGDPFGGAMGGMQRAQLQQQTFVDRAREQAEQERLELERKRIDTAGEQISGILADPAKSAGIDPELRATLKALAPADPVKALELYAQAIRDGNTRAAAMGEMTPEMKAYIDLTAPTNDAVYTPESIAAKQSAEQARIYRTENGKLHYDNTIGPEPNSLLVRADKAIYDRMQETNDEYEVAANRAGLTLANAGEVYKYASNPDKGGMFGAGQPAEWKDGLYQWMGWENRDAAMRQKLSRGITDDVMSQITKYQTGRGITDKDVEIYRQGYPSEYSNPQDLVRYELGQFKGATVTKAIEAAKSEYQNAQRDPAGWPAWLERNRTIIIEDALREAESAIQAAGIDVETVPSELSAPPATYDEASGQWVPTAGAAAPGTYTPPLPSRPSGSRSRAKTRGELRREMAEKRRAEREARQQSTTEAVTEDDLTVIRE